MASADTATDSAYRTLAAQRGRLDRASRSAQIADIVRASILDGTFLPGSRLSEPDICAALAVSRNTLREAFRSLVDERLAVHELNRGVFVRTPTPDDVRELYRCRRIVECAALKDAHSPGDLKQLAEVLERADAAATAEDWLAVGTADIEFHKAIAALNGSARLDGLMTTVWNELRMVFHVMADPLTFHRPYLERNHALLHAMSEHTGDAAAMLSGYLADAEKQILDAYPVDRRH